MSHSESVPNPLIHLTHIKGGGDRRGSIGVWAVTRSSLARDGFRLLVCYTEGRGNIKDFTGFSWRIWEIKGKNIPRSKLTHVSMAIFEPIHIQVFIFFRQRTAAAEWPLILSYVLGITSPVLRIVCVFTDQASMKLLLCQNVQPRAGDRRSSLKFC